MKLFLAMTLELQDQVGRVLVIDQSTGNVEGAETDKGERDLATKARRILLAMIEARRPAKGDARD